MMKYKVKPYVMRYEDWEKSPDPYKGIYITVARWCNQPSIFKKMSLFEFAEHQKASSKYVRDFERLHPHTAKYFFNLKWRD